MNHTGTWVQRPASDYNDSRLAEHRVCQIDGKRPVAVMSRIPVTNRPEAAATVISSPEAVNVCRQLSSLPDHIIATMIGAIRSADISLRVVQIMEQAREVSATVAKTEQEIEKSWKD